MSALLAFLVANSGSIIAVVGLIATALTHAKVLSNQTTSNDQANSLINTVTTFLDSYVQTVGVDKTIDSLRIELKGQVATLLARLGVYGSNAAIHALIDAGIDKAIELAVNKYIGTHPTPRTLSFDASSVRSNSGTASSFSPAKGT